VWGKGKEEWGTEDFLLTASSNTGKPLWGENGPKYAGPAIRIAFRGFVESRSGGPNGDRIGPATGVR
jgi:hypothetical protein